MPYEITPYINITIITALARLSQKKKENSVLCGILWVWFGELWE